MNFRCLHAAFAIAMSLLLCGIAAAQQARLPMVPLNIGMHVIQAEVAATEAQRNQGLMFRRTMGQEEGMLFDLERPALLECMWMKDTLIPLSVAFIDAAGKIINIEDMQPQTQEQHCSDKASNVRYALEMNLGWFKQKHIDPGALIEGLPNQK